MRFDRLVLIGLLLVLPTAFWLGSTSYEAIKLTLLALAGACWLGSLAWRLGTGRPVWRPPGGLLALGVSLLAVLCISAVNAHHTGLVWRTVILTALWLAVVLQTAATTASLSRMRHLLASAVIASVPVSLYALAQMVGWTAGASAESGFPSGISSLGNQNYVSGFAAVLLWPTVILWSGKSRNRRILAIAATVILAVTILFAQAAGPLMAITGSALLVGPLLLMVRKGLSRRVPVVLGLSLILFVLAGTVWTGSALRQASSPEPASPAFYHQVFLENHGDIRRTDWLVARELFHSSPWTGRGAGNYATLWPVTRARLQADPDISGLAGHEPLATRAHNDLFQFLSETGALGGLWFVVSCGMVVVFWWRRWRAFSDDSTRNPFLLLTAGLLTAGLHSMVSFPFHLPATALMLALFVGLMASPVFSGEPSLRPTWKGIRFLAVIPAILAFFLAGGAIQEFVGDIYTASGQRYFADGRMKPAVAHLEFGNARRHWPAENHLYLGLAKVATGEPDAARAYLEMSIAEKPTFEGYLALAELSVDQERHDEAAGLLTVVEGCQPFMTFRFQATYLRGLSELRQGNAAKARLLFRALLEDDPDNQRAWLALGYQEVLEGNRKQGRLYYTRALEIIQGKIRDVGGGESNESSGEMVRLNQHLMIAQKALKSINQR